MHSLKLGLPRSEFDIMYIFFLSIKQVTGVEGSAIEETISQTNGSTATIDFEFTSAVSFVPENKNAPASREFLRIALLSIDFFLLE